MVPSIFDSNNLEELLVIIPQSPTSPKNKEGAPQGSPVSSPAKFPEKRTLVFSFTPLESPGIHVGDVTNRKHRLLVKAGSKPHLSNGVNLLQNKSLTAETPRTQRSIFLFGGEIPPNKKPSLLKFTLESLL